MKIYSYQKYCCSYHVNDKGYCHIHRYLWK